MILNFPGLLFWDYCLVLAISVKLPDRGSEIHLSPRFHQNLISSVWDATFDGWMNKHKDIWRPLCCLILHTCCVYETLAFYVCCHLYAWLCVWCVYLQSFGSTYPDACTCLCFSAAFPTVSSVWIHNKPASSVNTCLTLSRHADTHWGFTPYLIIVQPHIF